jgi:hypothetical protein
MRTTLTIDDDVAFLLKRVQEKDPTRSFKEIVNEILRKGLNAKSNGTNKRKPFKVKPFNLGLRPGLSYDNIEELLDIAEGPLRR